jgi:precorrin-3B synthase
MSWVTVHLRPAADRCPGLLRPYRAEDGLLVRVRIPGGQTSSGILLALAKLAGTLQLTSRGNLQLRGIADDSIATLTDRIAGLGLLPSLSHELVRNIVASPLTGLTPNRPDLRPMVGELDKAICAKPDLAELPGRFLFAIDDGSGDVWPQAFDIGYRALDGQRGLVGLGGTSASSHQQKVRELSRAGAVAEMVRVATDFVRARQGATSAWRIWELGDFRAGTGELIEVEGSAGTPPGLGAVTGHACVGVPLGFLTAIQAAAVHSIAAGGPVVITPWRSLVIPGAARELGALRAAGLITDPDSPWTKITACVGAPGCAKSEIDTRRMAIEIAAKEDSPVRPVHVSGCQRRCGAPVGEHEELVGRP